MKFFLTLIFTLTTLFIQAQYNKEYEFVDVIPHWQKGDVFRYTQIENEYQIVKKDTLNKKNKQFDLVVSILDSTKNSYTVEWKMTPDFSQIPVSLQEDFKTKLGSQRFVYRTSENGVFEDLLNFDEIVSYNKKLVEIMGESIPKEMDRDAFKAALEKVFGNEEVTAQLITSKINTFHLFFGHKIKKNKSSNSKFESVNPVTKNKIIYNRMIELENYSEEDQVYTLYGETFPVEKNLIDEIKSTLETIISKQVKDMDKIQNFDYISKVFQASHDSGIIIYQMKRDFIEVDDQEIIKELEFVLK